MKKSAVRWREILRPFGWAALALAVVGSAYLGIVAVGVASLEAARPPAPIVDPLEAEALQRFPAPKVVLPNGTRVTPDEPTAKALSVSLFKKVLAQQEQRRDPAFRARAEAELAHRAPVRASMRWEDTAGNRELQFVVDDARACGLEGRTELTVTRGELLAYPCLQRGSAFSAEEGPFVVQLEAIAQGEPLWNEMLGDTMKALAGEAHLARLQGSGG